MLKPRGFLGAAFVNEEGTVAAATTYVGGFSGFSGVKPVDFIVNRPFLFAIKNNKTEDVVFMGRVLNPNE